MAMQYKLLWPTEDTVSKLEYLRFDVFEMDKTYLKENQTFYEQALLKGQVYAFGALLNNAIIAGCYVSVNLNNLYIDQLFVSKEYQKDEIGKHLLEYVLKHRKLIEELTGTILKGSFLDSCNKSQGFYEKLGYREKEGRMHKSF